VGWGPQDEVEDPVLFEVKDTAKGISQVEFEVAVGDGDGEGVEGFEEDVEPHRTCHLSLG